MNNANFKYYTSDVNDWEDIANIDVDIDSDGVYVSNDGSSGVSYKPKTLDELVEAFRDYVTSNPIIVRHFDTKEAL